MEEKEQWEQHLTGVAQASRGQWGDNFTILAISALLKRMVVVLSVGRSKKLSLYEIEPSTRMSDGESSGVPLIVSHYGDHHSIMPVRVKKDGPWGWVLNQEEGTPAATNQINEKVVPPSMVVDVSPPVETLMSSRISSPQRRSELCAVENKDQKAPSSMVLDACFTVGSLCE